MILSTLGFIFSSDLENVLLIEKQKPTEHKGRLNGLGGKCEAKESILQCMMRETLEESGLITSAKNWKEIGEMEWNEWHVHIFAIAINTKKIDETHLPSSVKWYPTRHLPSQTLSNIPWLVHLAKDYLTNEFPPTVHIQYLHTSLK